MPTEKCKYKKGTQTWLSTKHTQEKTSLFFFSFKAPATNEATLETQKYKRLVHSP